MSVEDSIYLSLTQLRRVIDECYDRTMPLHTVPLNARKELSDLIVQFALCEISGTKYEPPKLDNIMASTEIEVCDG